MRSPAAASALTFTTTDWNVPQTVTVSATRRQRHQRPAGGGLPARAAQSVEPGPGPALIDGGSDPAIGSDRACTPPVRGRVESNPPINSCRPAQPQPARAEAAGCRRAKRLNDNEVANVTGTLTETRITGFGMGAISSSPARRTPAASHITTSRTSTSIWERQRQLLRREYRRWIDNDQRRTGTDLVNIQTTDGVLTVNSGSGATTIDVGSGFTGTNFGASIKSTRRGA